MCVCVCVQCLGAPAYTEVIGQLLGVAFLTLLLICLDTMTKYLTKAAKEGNISLQFWGLSTQLLNVWWQEQERTVPIAPTVRSGE